MFRLGLMSCVFFLSISCCHAKYFSQIGQDEIVNTRYFKNKKRGVFVDIGAHNGITFSNTYFFEKKLKWSGLCVEPMPEVFAQLQKNRSCHCVKGCVTDFEGPADFLRITSPCAWFEMLSGLLQKYDPRHLDRVHKDIKTLGGTIEIIQVDCYLINTLLEKYGLYHVDFMSLDTEGGEYDIISTIDFSKYEIDVITLEDNYNDPRFVPFLESKGYRFIERNEFDLLFVREAFLQGV